MNDQERAAFEAWGRAEGLEDKAIGRGMDYPLGEHLWRAWQAGRAALAAAPQVPAVPDGIDLLVDVRGSVRMAIVMMRDFGGLLRGCDFDADSTDWEQVLHSFESAMDAAIDQPAPQAPAVPVGYKLLKDTTHDERRWHEDAKHENGNYFNECVRCLRSFVGHKRRGVCRACAQPEAAPGAPQPAERVPLTVPQILELMPDKVPASYDGQLLDFARAIEAAHGIRAAGVKEPGNVRGEAGQTAPPALDTEPN